MPFWSICGLTGQAKAADHCCIPLVIRTRMHGKITDIEFDFNLDTDDAQQVRLPLLMHTTLGKKGHLALAGHAHFNNLDSGG